MTLEIVREMLRGSCGSALTRDQRRSLRQAVASAGLPTNMVGQLRALAFELARERLPGGQTAVSLEWLRDVLDVLVLPAAEVPVIEAYFSPGDDCRDVLLRRLRLAESTIHACVYSITDDGIAEALISARRSGRDVRIISDDETASALGADVTALKAAGVRVRLDSGPEQMHHKFVVLDRRIVITGSYNWTTAARRHNQENMILTTDGSVATAYEEVFERLWRRYAGG